MAGLNLDIGKPAVGSALGIARGLRAKAEEKKRQKQAILRQSQQANKDRSAMLKARAAEEQAKNKAIAAEGAQGNIGKREQK